MRSPQLETCACASACISTQTHTPGGTCVHAWVCTLYVMELAFPHPFDEPTMPLGNTTAPGGACRSPMSSVGRPQVSATRPLVSHRPKPLEAPLNAPHSVGVWHELDAKLNQARCDLALISHHNALFAVGGREQKGSVLCTVERLNTQAGGALWEVFPHLNVGRRDPILRVLSSEVLAVMGGYNNQGQLCCSAEVSPPSSALNAPPKPSMTPSGPCGAFMSGTRPLGVKEFLVCTNILTPFFVHYDTCHGLHAHQFH